MTWWKKYVAPMLEQRVKINVFNTNPQSVKKSFSFPLLFSKQNRPPFHSWHNHDFHINTFIHLVEVRQEYCRAHHLTGNYRTASDTWIQVSTNRNASPWRRLHWRHDDRKMTSQWCARTFGGVTREVSSYIMMHMHGGFGKPRSFPHQLICGGPT